jgi:hypothetical protein
MTAMTAKTVKTSFFGEVDAPDGGIALMDGGIHGVQGHTIIAPPSGAAKWERRIDGVQPLGKPGSGELDPSSEERARLASWRDAVWDLAGAGKDRYWSDFSHGPPRWVWVIAVRRGDEIRAVQGGDMSWGDEPEPLASALAWLRETVDALGA